MILRSLLLVLALALSARSEEFLPGVKRILFLGDSITYAGEYVAQFETFTLLHYPERHFDIIDMGLPSETVSGLSEEGHAGGQFPRPDLHERLARVLPRVKPDLVFACYGMNDGIYLPLADDRFAAYQNGIRKLHEAVIAAGAKIIHLTPPVFDPQPIKDKVSADGSKPQYAKYDDVLARYSAWLMEQRQAGWTVIDLHTPMKAALEASRAKNPNFAYAKDGVHANAEGHLVMAAALLQGLGQTPAIPDSPLPFAKLLRQRQKMRTDAWLTACGHLRPGMAKGLPLEEAEAKAAEMMAEIRKQLAQPKSQP